VSAIFETNYRGNHGPKPLSSTVTINPCSIPDSAETPSTRRSERVRIPDSELKVAFVRATGPGGQNVNKVSTAVQLRFDINQSPSLTDAMKNRLRTLAGNRATQDGVLMITAREHRTQEANRTEARARLDDLIARAQVVPKTRRPSRPTLGSKLRRLTAKLQRSSSKKLRGHSDED
jgi:ribosome-associated protein